MIFLEMKFLLVLSLLIKGHSVHKRATDVSSAEYIYNRHKKTYESEVGEMHLSCMQWPWFSETMSAFCYNFTPYSSLSSLYMRWKTLRYT